MHRLKAQEIRAAILIIRELDKLDRPLAIKEIPLITMRSHASLKPIIDRLIHTRILKRESFRSGLEKGDKWEVYWNKWLEDYT